MMTKELSYKFANMALLCAVLVVSIHIGRNHNVGSPAWFFSQVISSGVALIAVPFFFFASGFFLFAHANESGWWPREVKKRCRTLLLPYFIWNILFLLYFNGIQFLSNVVAHAPLSRDLWSPDVLSMFGFNIFVQPVLFVLWYVRALILLVLISPCVFALLKRFGWGMLVFCFVVYALIVPGDLEGASMLQPLKWTFSLSGLFYFSFGAWVREKEVLETWNWLRLRWVALVVGVAALGIQVATQYYSWNWPVSLSPLMVLFLAIGIFAFMPDVQFPSWLCGCSFPIFILHCFCRFVPIWTIKNSFDSLLGLFVVWAVTVALCVVLTVVMRRFLPRIAGVLFGGR